MHANRIILISLISVLTLQLFGCAVGPDYKRPVTVVPYKFKEAPKGWKIARPNDDFNRGQWWTIFHSSELNALEARLNISNQTIATSLAQYEQAREIVDEARAGYYPTLVGSASATRQKQVFAGANSAVAATTTSAATDTTPAITTSLGSGSTASISTSHTLLFNASWEPDIWGIIRRTVEADKAAAQASEAQLALARLSAQASLATFYFELRGLDSDQKLLDDTVADDQSILKLVKNEYASGTAAQADIVAAESQLEAARALAVNNGVNRAIYQHAIAVLIGRPASTFSLQPKVVKFDVPRIPLQIPSILLERRPDIASSERLMAQANAQIGVAIGAFFPTPTLSGSVSFQHTGLEKWISYPLMSWAVGPQIAETIFDGGLRSATVCAARANYRATVATYRETVLAAFQDVEDNLSSLRILQTEQAVQDRAAADARLSLQLVKNQYMSGTVPFSSIITAQIAAFTAEKNAIDVRYLRMNYAVGLVRALGGGWNNDAISSTCKYS